MCLEILMFVSKKIPNTVVMPQMLLTSLFWLELIIKTKRVIKLSDIAALYGVFLETNKHQNLMMPLYDLKLDASISTVQLNKHVTSTVVRVGNKPCC